MTQNQPRILVGCPTAEAKRDSLPAYLAGLNALTYPNIDIVLEDNSPTEKYAEEIRTFARGWEEKHSQHTFRVIHSGHVSPRVRERIVHGRNMLREVALNENYDYFFSLEQDVSPPPTVIERLLARTKPVVGGVYYNSVTLNGKKMIMPVLMTYPNEESKKKNIAQWTGFPFLFPSRLVEVACMGLGCVLIHRDVLAQVPFRMVEGDPAFDDIHFANDLHKKNISLYVDTSILCGHEYNTAFKNVPDAEW